MERIRECKSRVNGLVNIVKNITNMQCLVLCAHCQYLKIILKNLILRCRRVCKTLCKVINNFLRHACSLPAEQVDISWNKIALNKVIEIDLDIAFQVKHPCKRLKRGCAPCRTCKPVHGYMEEIFSRER